MSKLTNKLAKINKHKNEMKVDVVRGVASEDDKNGSCGVNLVIHITVSKWFTRKQSSNIDYWIRNL